MAVVGRLDGGGRVEFFMDKSPKRIVVKFGSGILANPQGTSLDDGQIQRLSAEVADLVKFGHECVIVSSGAVAAGLGVLGLNERPEDLVARQACAAIGQSKLMQSYTTHFENYGLNVAQLLLTYSDLDSRTASHNVANTLARLFERRTVVPIINENDPVAVEELKFGDNDRLSAEVALLVDGLLDEQGQVVRVVEEVGEVASLARQEKGKFSVGGMISKLQAVKSAVDGGISTYIVSGTKAGQMGAVVEGRVAGTRFLGKGETR